jgi:hypothetical protein
MEMLSHLHSKSNKSWYYPLEKGGPIFEFNDSSANRIGSGPFLLISFFENPEQRDRGFLKNPQQPNPVFLKIRSNAIAVF